MPKISKSNIFVGVAISAIALVLVLTLVIKEDKKPTNIFQFPANYNVLVNNLEKKSYEIYKVETPQKKDLDTTADIVGSFINHYYMLLANFVNENAEERAYELMVESFEKTFGNEDDITALEPFTYPVALISAFNEESNSYIFVIYFDNTQSAKELYEILKPYFDFVKKNSSDDYVFDEGVNITINDFVSGQTGKVVYLSTKNALNDIN